MAILSVKLSSKSEDTSIASRKEVVDLKLSVGVLGFDNRVLVTTTRHAIFQIRGYIHFVMRIASRK
jgi:hypothetical protein